MITATNIKRGVFLFVWLAMAGCGRGGCPGPELDWKSLNAIKAQTFSEGPTGFLVVPNPIDATGNIYAGANDSTTLAAGQMLRLPQLLSPSRLESSFIKVRLHAASDALSSLAQPTNGTYQFRVLDNHYSEVMAYASAITAQTYLDLLGFPPVKSRPLVIYPRAQDGGSVAAQDVNAFYAHNTALPNQPRELSVYGDTNFAPAADRDIFYHEFGHLNNESFTREVGMDKAGDAGAVYTEASALHECLADYLAESMGDKSYMAVWAARNFSEIRTGQPLRSAVDSADSDITTFRSVGVYDGTGASPERYRVAEWCTRILWKIRSGFVEDDQEIGGVRSDLLVFSATSLLQQDTSIEDFERALVAADQALFCGGHSGDIENAFERRGFAPADELSKPLEVQVQPLNVGANRVAMRFSVANSSEQYARNVRVYLESTDSRLQPLTYMQGFGDLPPNARIVVGGGGGLPVDFSVTGQVSSGLGSGSVPFRLRVKTQNGDDVVVQGVL